MKKEARKSALYRTLIFLGVMNFIIILACISVPSEDIQIVGVIIMFLIINGFGGTLSYLLLYHLWIKMLKYEEHLDFIQSHLSEESYTEVFLISTEYYDNFIAKLLDSCTAKYTAIIDSKYPTNVIINVELKNLAGDIVYNDIFEEMPIQFLTDFYNFKED